MDHAILIQNTFVKSLDLFLLEHGQLALSWNMDHSAYQDKDFGPYSNRDKCKFWAHPAPAPGAHNFIFITRKEI